MRTYNVGSQSIECCKPLPLRASCGVGVEAIGKGAYISTVVSTQLLLGLRYVVQDLPLLHCFAKATDAGMTGGPWYEVERRSIW